MANIPQILLTLGLRQQFIDLCRQANKNCQGKREDRMVVLHTNGSMVEGSVKAITNKIGLPMTVALFMARWEQSTLLVREIYSPLVPDIYHDIAQF